MAAGLTAQETWGPEHGREGGRRGPRREEGGRGPRRGGGDLGRWVGKVSDLSIRAAPRDVARGMHYIITNPGGLQP